MGIGHGHIQIVHGHGHGHGVENDLKISLLIPDVLERVGHHSDAHVHQVTAGHLWCHCGVDMW